MTILNGSIMKSTLHGQVKKMAGFIFILFQEMAKTMTPITKGNIDVVSINCIDGKGGYVYYIASPENFTQRYLYRSRIDGKGIAEMITPADGPAIILIRFQMMPDGQFIHLIMLLLQTESLL